MSSTLVVLSARLGAVLPAAALPALRSAERIYADDTVPEHVVAELGAEPADRLLAEGAPGAPGGFGGSPGGSRVLLTTDPKHPMREHAHQVIETVEPPGAALLDAVAVMDRLRSPGGCPWDAEQTHRTLLQYLVEECYELHQAVEDADWPALREELGDVLLQVLFHSRLALEGGVAPFGPSPAFGIDEVAEELVSKLVGRHPHVFARDRDGLDQADRVRTAHEQERRWDELKRVEKSRESALDGVALGQPAAALAAKLISRAAKAGVPKDLMSSENELFDQVATVKLAGEDPEQRLRDGARSFAADLRAAENAARAAGLDQHRLTEAQWRRHWPG